MKKFITGEDRDQLALFPERLDDSIAEDNPVRFIDLFIDELDLLELGFDKVEPSDWAIRGVYMATEPCILTPKSSLRT
jgi:hypothetical protein